jgi:hypothetical protein
MTGTMTMLPAAEDFTLTDELRKSLHDNLPSIFGEPVDT